MEAESRVCTQTQDSALAECRLSGERQHAWLMHGPAPGGLHKPTVKLYTPSPRCSSAMQPADTGTVPRACDSTRQERNPHLSCLAMHA